LYQYVVNEASLVSKRIFLGGAGDFVIIYELKIRGHCPLSLS